jgi:hypothetical protein
MYSPYLGHVKFAVFRLLPPNYYCLIIPRDGAASAFSSTYFGDFGGRKAVRGNSNNNSNTGGMFLKDNLSHGRGSQGRGMERTPGSCSRREV